MTQIAQISPAPEDQGYHYQVMRRAIALIDEAEDPKQLDWIAGEMGMSAAHFQRLFSRWVGVSPKRYQQYLMLDQAKVMLRDHFTTLAAAHELGLSGSGRLHDLFLRWEAMSPGDYGAGGAGLEIREGRFDSPFGPVVAMGTDRGLCGLGFAAETGTEPTLRDLRARWPAARFSEVPDALAPWVEAAFSGRGEARLQLIGAPFAIKVWQALLEVPSGHVTTYSDIAARIGAPRAVRAAATAVGRNPISWLIPCHRALRKSGELGGYHWGLPVKRAMLAFEAARGEG